MKSMSFYLIVTLLIITVFQLQAATEDIQWMKPGHSGITKVLCLSNDGKYLATNALDSTVKIIDTDNDSLLFRIKLNAIIKFSGITPDKSKFILGTYNTQNIPIVNIYNIKGQTVQDSYTPDSLFNSKHLIISSDSKYLTRISQSNKHSLWDVETGKIIGTFEKENSDKAYYTFFSSDNNKVVVVYDNSVKVFDIVTGEIVKSINVVNTVYSRGTINKAETQLMVFAANNGKYELYDLTSGNLISSGSIPGFNLSQVFLLDNPDKLIAHINNQECLIWDIKENKLIKMLDFELLSDISFFSKNGKEMICTGGRDGVTRIWKANFDTEVIFQTNDYSSMIFCNKEKSILNRSFNIFDIENAQTQYISTNRIYSVRDTNIFYYNIDSMIYFGNFDNYNIFDSVNLHLNIRSLQMSDNMNYCVYSTKANSSVNYILDWKSKQVIYSDSILVFQFSKNNQFAYGINLKNKQLKIIDLEDKKVIHIMNLTAIANSYFSFSPDSKHFFIRISGEKTKMYDINNFDLLMEFDTGIEPKAVTPIVITSDNKFMIDGADNGDIRIWDISNGNLIYKYSGYNEKVQSLDISWDSKYILSGFRDGTSILWKAKLGNTSIKNIFDSESFKIKILPNPTNGIVNINLENYISNDKVQMFLYDFLGNEIKKLDFSIVENTIDMSRQLNGTYYLRVIIGEQTETFKIIKMD